MSHKKFDGQFPPKTQPNKLLSDILSFGSEKSDPAHAASSQPTEERLKKLVKDIENIGKRIDKLSGNY